MRQMSSVKKSCICAICIALCLVLPIAFHALGVGGEFSPMHIPVLLCGLLLGPGYGAFCGIAGPILSATTGMPTLTQCFYMVPELCVYGLTAGLLMKWIRTRRTVVDLSISLIGAMLLGRIVGGLAQGVVIGLLGTGEVFTPALWVGAYFVKTLPGILAQLILIPILVSILEKAKLIPPRYPKETGGSNGKETSR